MQNHHKRIFVYCAYLKLPFKSSTYFIRKIHYFSTWKGGKFRQPLIQYYSIISRINLNTRVWKLPRGEGERGAPFSLALHLLLPLVQGNGSGNETPSDSSSFSSKEKVAVTRDGDQAIRGSWLGRIFSPVPPSPGLSTFFTGSRFYSPAVPRN